MKKTANSGYSTTLCISFLFSFFCLTLSHTPILAAKKTAAAVASLSDESTKRVDEAVRAFNDGSFKKDYQPRDGSFSAKVYNRIFTKKRAPDDGPRQKLLAALQKLSDDDQSFRPELAELQRRFEQVNKKMHKNYDVRTPLDDVLSLLKD